MMALALNILDLFLKPKANPFSWLCAVGSFFILSGFGFGLYFGFNRLVPLLGHFETGMLLSGSLILLGGILMLTARCKRQKPTINKALDTLKDKTDNLHLKETYENHKDLILAASFVAGILLPLFSKFRKGNSSKSV